MRLRPVSEEESPDLPLPFPIKLYLVGVTKDGAEAFRHDLGCSFTAIGQTVHIPDPKLEIIP